MVYMVPKKNGGIQKMGSLCSYYSRIWIILTSLRLFIPLSLWRIFAASSQNVYLKLLHFCFFFLVDRQHISPIQVLRNKKVFFFSLQYTIDIKWTINKYSTADHFLISQICIPEVKQWYNWILKQYIQQPEHLLYYKLITRVER